MNLSSNVLDKPVSFGMMNNPSLDPLYEMGRQCLEIEERVEILNERKSLLNLLMFVSIRL